MSTAMFGVVQSIPGRIDELRLLTSLAASLEAKNEALYNAACRSCCVLIASHLEGFLKEVSRALVVDLNYYSDSFDKIPIALRRSFCRKIAFYEGVPSSEIEERTKQLLTFFEKNPVEVDLHAFKYKENVNKNPSEAVIDSVFSKFGLDSVIAALSPVLDDLFDNDRETDFRIVRRLKRERAKLFTYPYRQLDGRIRMLPRKPKKDEKSLWAEYVKSIMDRRHTIAHGDTMENPTSWEALDRDVDKLNVLLHGLAFSACAGLVSKAT